MKYRKMNQNTDYIPFTRPSISAGEEKAVLAVLRSGWLTTGKIAKKFEDEFADFTGAVHALAVNSATAGLHLSLEALDVKPHTLVITSPYTFTATAEVIRYMNADPLFVDIEKATYNIDVRKLEKVLCTYNKKISAVIPVHLAGLPCEIEELIRIAGAYDIPVVEDAAHCLPGRLPGGFAGTYGRTGVFSFYASKSITTGEGGMVITGDDRIADRMRLMRLHGIDREAWERYTDPAASWHYRVVEAGFKYNLTDMAAAVGREQLKQADQFHKRRREIAARYINAFSDCDFLIPPVEKPGHAWHLFLLRIKPDLLEITRDQYIRALQDQGIGISVHYIPLHIMPYYEKRYQLKPQDYPVALENYLASFSLPIYPGLRDEQVAYIIDAVKDTGFQAYKKQLIQGTGQ